MNKNKFWTFVFSIIPGCGLMYLGYMKKGLQTMLTFCTSLFFAIAIASMRYSYSFEWLMIFFILTLPVIWLYQMFDTMNTISRMRKSGIEVPSDDGFFFPAPLKSPLFPQNRTIVKAAAYILIALGCFWFFSNALDALNRYSDYNHNIGRIIDALQGYLVPGAVSVALIAAGFKLLSGNKRGRGGVDFNADISARRATDESNKSDNSGEGDKNI